jgi:hypothetical protein
MTVAELAEFLKRYQEFGGPRNQLERPGQTVVVQTAMGGVPCARVLQVTSGGEWLRDKMVLHLDEPIVVARVLRDDVESLGERRLAQFTEAHKRFFGGKCMPSTHRRTWLEGFAEGVRQMVTSVQAERGAQ